MSALVVCITRTERNKSECFFSYSVFLNLLDIATVTVYVNHCFFVLIKFYFCTMFYKWTLTCLVIAGKCDSSCCENIQHVWPANAHE